MVEPDPFYPDWAAFFPQALLYLKRFKAKLKS
jgi:hypothetical protein